MKEDIEFAVADIGVKCRNKCEVYTVLSWEGGIFIPSISNVCQMYLLTIILFHLNYFNC